MGRQQDRRAQFNRYGPFALVIGVAAVALAVTLLRSHKIDRFEVAYFIALLPTVILHEVSHGVVANWCGDDTAKRAGRLTLNPLRHIDPIGSVVMPIVLLLAHFPAFGYAKPVPVSVNRLRHPRNQSLLVSLAGPATNLLIATFAGIAFHFLIVGGTTNPNSPIPLFLFALGLVNVIVGVFNLIPIPPLDGSAVLERFIPADLLPGYYRLRQFSIIIVLFFVLFDQNALSSLFSWVEIRWENLVF